MLRLTSQPTITIRSKNVSIIPDIPDAAIINGNEDSLGKERYCVAFEIDLANIGNQPAQNVYVDAEIHFKVNRPLGKKSLPVHLPEFISFLAPQTIENKTASVSARFDNFVARELIRDFFEGRRNMEGSPFFTIKGRNGKFKAMAITKGHYPLLLFGYPRPQLPFGVTAFFPYMER